MDPKKEIRMNGRKKRREGRRVNLNILLSRTQSTLSILTPKHFYLLS
jgi:hypothetical protein